MGNHGLFACKKKKKLPTSCVGGKVEKNEDKESSGVPRSGTV